MKRRVKIVSALAALIVSCFFCISPAFAQGWEKAAAGQGIHGINGEFPTAIRLRLAYATYGDGPDYFDNISVRDYTDEFTLYADTPLVLDYSGLVLHDPNFQEDYYTVDGSVTLTYSPSSPPNLVRFSLSLSRSDGEISTRSDYALERTGEGKPLCMVNDSHRLTLYYEIMGLYYGPVQTQTVTTDASGSEGEMSFAIPAAIIAASAAGAAILGAKKKRGRRSGKDSSSEDENDEPQNRYEMRVFKNFGDTFIPGETETVYARIVEITPDGKENTSEVLTRQIRIYSEAFLRVSGCIPAGEFMKADVTAPESGAAPEEATVVFDYDGIFKVEMNFRIAGQEIVFGQDNLTLPACCAEPVSLPFLIKNSSGEETVSLEISPRGTYSVSYEKGTDGLSYAVIKDDSKKKMEAGTWESFILYVKVQRGKRSVSNSLPVYRFHEGLAVSLTHIPCYLKDRKPAEETAMLTAYSLDMENNDVVTVCPVPKEMKLTATDESRQSYLDSLGICCEASGGSEGSGRLLTFSCGKAILDPPTRFTARLSLTADCGNYTETVEKEISMYSQPVRQAESTEQQMQWLKRDSQISEGLQNIQKYIWDNGLYSRLFPLDKYIDAMLDGYDPSFGYDDSQYDTVKDVFLRFINGETAGANATAASVTLGDEMRMYIDSFLSTSEQVEDSMGFFTRMGVGVVTLGMADVVSTGLKVVRDMKAVAEKGGDTLSVFEAGVKTVTYEYLMEKAAGAAMSAGKKVLNTVAPDLKKDIGNALTGMKKSASKAAENAKSFFTSSIGEKAGSVLKKSKAVKANAKSKAGTLVEQGRTMLSWSDDEKALEKMYREGQKIGKNKVDDLRAAQWLAESNPTKENLAAYNKAVLSVQQDKYAMRALNELDGGDAVRSRFNRRLNTIYQNTDIDAADELRKMGYDVDTSPFQATSTKKDDLFAGKKVTYDRDVSFYTRDGKPIPQDAAEQAYNRAFYRNSTGIEPPNDSAAGRWASINDQAVVQSTSAENYGSLRDLKSVISDHSVRLENAGRVGRTVRYKTNEWLRKAEYYKQQAAAATDPAQYRDCIQQYLCCREEGVRQMVKQYRYVEARDVAAVIKGGTTKVTPHLRVGEELCAKIFEGKSSSSPSLIEIEKILKEADSSIELLAELNGQAMTNIG